MATIGGVIVFIGALIIGAIFSELISLKLPVLKIYLFVIKIEIRNWIGTFLGIVAAISSYRATIKRFRNRLASRTNT